MYFVELGQDLASKSLHSSNPCFTLYSDFEQLLNPSGLVSLSVKKKSTSLSGAGFYVLSLGVCTYRTGHTR